VSRFRAASFFQELEDRDDCGVKLSAASCASGAAEVEDKGVEGGERSGSKGIEWPYLFESQMIDMIAEPLPGASCASATAEAKEKEVEGGERSGSNSSDIWLITSRRGGMQILQRTCDRTGEISRHNKQK
jgi:hypothetical protein